LQVLELEHACLIAELHSLKQSRNLWASSNFAEQCLYILIDSLQGLLAFAEDDCVSQLDSHVLFLFFIKLVEGSLLLDNKHIAFLLFKNDLLLADHKSTFLAFACLNFNQVGSLKVFKPFIDLQHCQVIFLQDKRWVHISSSIFW